jgi:hypothetical protein
MKGCKLKKIGRNTYFVNGKHILKSESPSKTVVKKIMRLFLGGSLPFQNEVAFHLANKDFLCMGEVLELNKTNVLVVKFIENEIDKLHQMKIREIALSVFFKLSHYNIHNSFSILKRVLFYIMEHPTFRTIRECLNSKDMNFFLKIKLIIHTVSLHRKINKIKNIKKNILIHNDMALNNILILNDEVVLIDFEDSMFIKDWILVDITDLYYFYETFSEEVVFEELQLISRKLNLELTDEELYLHAKFGKLRSLIRITLFNRESADRKKEALNELRKFKND